MRTTRSPGHFLRLDIVIREFVPLVKLRRRDSCRASLMLPPRPFDATIKRALVGGRVCNHQHEAEDKHQQGADSNAGKERPQHQVFPNRQGLRTQELVGPCGATAGIAGRLVRYYANPNLTR